MKKFVQKYGTVVGNKCLRFCYKIVFYPFSISILFSGKIISAGYAEIW